MEEEKYGDLIRILMFPVVLWNWVYSRYKDLALEISSWLFWVEEYRKSDVEKKNHDDASSHSRFYLWGAMEP